MEFIDDPRNVGAGEGRVWIIDNNKIYLSVFQQGSTGDGSLVRHLDMHMWKLFVELVQIWNQIVPADGIAGTNAELAAI